MLSKTQVCILKIWIKETLSLSKVRGAITVDILLLKYQKQAVTAVLNSQYNQSNTKNNTHMVLPNALRKSWMYQMLLFIVSRVISPIRNKVRDREFHWSVDHEFYFRLGIWNCTSVCSTDKFVWKLMILCKNDSSLEKRKQFHWRIFLEKSKSSLQENLQNKGSDTKFSYQMLP